MSGNLVGLFQNMRTVLCVCPCCGELVRASDLHLSYRGKATKTWLDEYDKAVMSLDEKEAKFEGEEDEIRQKAIERGRQQVVERACSCLDSKIACYNYNPYDIKALFHPVDFVVFNGLNSEALEDVTFLTRARRGDGVQKSLKSAIESKNYDWKVARVTEEGGVKYE